MTVVEFHAPVAAPAEQEVLTEREQRADREVATDAERRARTLEAAALEIEVHGHATFCKSTDGRMCIGGAIFQAMGYDVSPGATFTHSVVGLGPDGGWDVLDSIWGDHFQPVAWWNDTEATPTEAIARLRSRAAEIRDGR